MQAHESRYAHKLRSLRGELDLAYKQSSVHSEKHLERIKELESSAKTEQSRDASAIEQRYAAKIKSLREELEKAYKQSTVHSEKHLERIRFLEAELAKLQNAGGESKPASTERPHELSHAEGDLAGGVAKFAGSEKWYKQPAITPVSIKRDLEKAEQKKRDRALVREIREIYEKRYGVIGNRSQSQLEQEADLTPRVSSLHDQQHKLRAIKQRLERGMAGMASQESQTAAFPSAAEAQLTSSGGSHKRSRSDAYQRGREVEGDKGTKVIEVESNVDLGEALANYEKEMKEDYGTQHSRASGLGQDIASTNALKAKAVAAREREVHEGVKLVNDEVPRLIPTELPGAGDIVPATQREPTIDWAEPPMYKIVAYDAGNDMMSTATTTSNFTGAESAISISDAMKDLYAPAKFLPHFAGLQGEGYQVVYGAKDLVVLRKLKELQGGGRQQESPVKQEPGIEDHGVITSQSPNVESQKNDANNITKTASSTVNPIDGTAGVHSAPSSESKAREAVEESDVEYYNVSDRAQSGHVEIEDAYPQPVRDPLSDHANYDTNGDDWEIKHYPRVKREEYPVFTGTRRKWRPISRKQKKKGKRAVWWMVKVGAGAAGVAYLVGAAAEKGRSNERLVQQKREERESRWR